MGYCFSALGVSSVGKSNLSKILFDDGISGTADVVFGSLAEIAVVGDSLLNFNFERPAMLEFCLVWDICFFIRAQSSF